MNELIKEYLTIQKDRMETNFRLQGHKRRVKQRPVGLNATFHVTEWLGGGDRGDGVKG